MKIRVNGEVLDLEDIANLKELIETFGINPNTVVVEHNKMVVSRQKLETAPVCEGDTVEIVQFVGGGKPLEGEAEKPADGPAAAEVAPEPSPIKKKKSASKKPRAKSKTKGNGAGNGQSKGAKNLVIVESPAKAKTINKFLGKDYLVEASFGHVRDLPKSKMGVDIESGFVPQYKIMRKAQKTVTHLKKMAKGKSGIFLAPDPDREGEAISWHLAHIFREVDPNLPIHRVVFNEITREAILEAFQKPREIAMNLVNAQQARRILDRLVGYELSPLLWRKVGRGLSAGRVQSVALRIIVDREREIKKFVPVEYWSILAKLSSEKPELVSKIFTAKLEKIGTEKADLKNKEQTEAIREEILSLPFRVNKVDQNERKRRPQAPYTTSKIQQEAYNRLGFSAAKTMRTAQKLYEGLELGDQGSVGLITYMRTDSVNVAKSAHDELLQYIARKFGKDFLPPEPNAYKSKKGAQEAHEAIRPTSVLRDPDSVKQYLPEDEFKLYDLIWRKFVASQMSPAVDRHMSVIIAAGDKYFFKATGRINIFMGFSVVFQDLKLSKATAAGKKDETKDETDDEQESFGELPPLVQGELLKLHDLNGYQHFTKPPPRYNDASIVKTLEEKGIGRPSTYAPTIFTLLSREYVNRQGGALIPTELGETVVDLLVEHFAKVMEVEFTAGMEEELDKIEEGQMDWVKVLKDFYGPFEVVLQVARVEMKNIKQEVVETEYTCDICGKKMVIKWGRFGKFLACPGFPDCKYTRSIPSGFLCPNEGCGGELVKRASKKRRYFYGCSKYPVCTYITNKLPKAEDKVSEDEKLSEADRETLEP